MYQTLWGVGRRYRYTGWTFEDGVESLLLSASARAVDLLRAFARACELEPMFLHLVPTRPRLSFKCSSISLVASWRSDAEKGPA